MICWWRASKKSTEAGFCLFHSLTTTEMDIATSEAANRLRPEAASLKVEHHGNHVSKNQNRKRSQRNLCLFDQGGKQT